MATNSLQAESASANPLESITVLACKMQELLLRAKYLSQALDDASEVVVSRDEDSRTALDRIIVFNGLIEDAVAAARDQAEEIEKIGIRLKYPS